jgi:hypothetical protein
LDSIHIVLSYEINYKHSFDKINIILGASKMSKNHKSPARACKIIPMDRWSGQKMPGHFVVRCVIIFLLTIVPYLYTLLKSNMTHGSQRNGSAKRVVILTLCVLGMLIMMMACGKKQKAGKEKTPINNAVMADTTVKKDTAAQQEQTEEVED